MVNVLRQQPQQHRSGACCASQPAEEAFEPGADAPCGLADKGQSLQMLLPRVWRFALRLTGSTQLAETLVARTYSLAFRDGAMRTGDQLPFVQLLTILHAEWVQGMSSRRHMEPVDLTTAFHHTTSEKSSDEAKRIRVAVDQLADLQRSVLLMVEVEQLCLACAAAVVGIQPSQAQRYLRRGHRRVSELVTTGVRLGDRLND
ncbi:RNA polymerase sigma factor [Paraburkholderia sp. 2C]|jgi:DNA-directed RNA polymerase specialized sigma24 family protein